MCARKDARVAPEKSEGISLLRFDCAASFPGFAFQ